MTIADGSFPTTTSGLHANHQQIKWLLNPTSLLRPLTWWRANRACRTSVWAASSPPTWGVWRVKGSSGELSCESCASRLPGGTRSGTATCQSGESLNWTIKKQPINKIEKNSGLHYKSDFLYQEWVIQTWHPWICVLCPASRKGQRLLHVWWNSQTG